MTNIINTDLIDLNLRSTDKAEIIEHMAELINSLGSLDNKAEYIQAVIEREKCCPLPELVLGLQSRTEKVTL